MNFILKYNNEVIAVTAFQVNEFRINEQCNGIEIHTVKAKYQVKFLSNSQTFDNIIRLLRSFGWVDLSDCETSLYLNE